MTWAFFSFLFSSFSQKLLFYNLRYVSTTKHDTLYVNISEVWYQSLLYRVKGLVPPPLTSQRHSSLKKFKSQTKSWYPLLLAWGVGGASVSDTLLNPPFSDGIVFPSYLGSLVHLFRTRLCIPVSFLFPDGPPTSTPL